MSTTIDSRVVEMQFDNAQFERNVKTTMSTLDKLKQSLKFEGISNGLDNLQNAFRKVDMSPMGNALDVVSSKFSALEVIGISALSRLTQKAVDTGVQFVKSLSVDNISAGWQKFADKTTSVGTLISQGYDIDTVTEQLDRLNWFTDETSYNFVDMVSNIAKFTASGQDLETSVTALEGIANWAALSGQNAATASRAMFQLSQAMGAGVMRKEDYKSIQNVSMDTDEFRQKALDAAVALGTLQKTGEDTYKSLVAGTDEFKKSQFAEHLTKDAWFTSDVMMKVFNDYSSAVDQIYEYAEEKGITASEAIEELGDSVDAFGLKAFRAAQEARTWSDVVDSVKDAVSTSWMTTFELIFGNYEEAKSLWTTMANELYDVFMASAEVRNEMLGEWRDMGGRERLLEGVADAWEGIKSVIEEVKTAFENAFPQLTADRLYVITDRFADLAKKFREFFEETKLVEVMDISISSTKDSFETFTRTVEKVNTPLMTFKEILSGLFESAHNVLSGFVNIGKMAKGVLEEVFPISVLDTISVVVEKVREFTESFRKLTELKTVKLTDIIGFTNHGEEHISGEIVEINEKAEKLQKILHGVASAFALVKDVVVAVAKGFAPLKQYLIDAGGSLLDAGAEFDDFIQKMRKGAEDMKLFETITTRVSGVVEALSGFIFDFVNNAIVSFGEGGGGLGGVFEVLFDKIADVVRLIFDLASAITGIDFSSTRDKIVGFVQTIRNVVVPIVTKVVDFFKSIPETLSDAFETLTGKTPAEVFKELGDKVSEAFDKIKTAVEGFRDVDYDGLDKLEEKTSPLKTLLEGIKKLFSGIVTFFKSLSPVFNAIAEALGKAFGKIGEALQKIFEDFDSGDLLHLIEGGSIAAIAAAIKRFFDQFSDLGWDLEKIGKKIKGVLSGVKGVLYGYQNDLNASALLKIAAAVGVLAVAIIALSAIEGPKIAGTLTALSVGLAEIVGVMEIMAKTLTMKEVTVIKKASSAMVIAAAAIVLLSAAVKKLGEMEMADLAKGVGAVGVLLAELSGAMYILGNIDNKKITKNTTVLLALALAVEMLAKPVKIIGELPLDQIAKGIGSVTVLIAELVGSMAILSLLDANGMAKNAVALLGMALSIKMLVEPVKELGALALPEIIQGIIAIGVIAAELSAALLIVSKSGAGLKEAIALVSIALTLRMLVGPIQELGALGTAELVKGITSLGVALGLLVAALLVVGNAPGALAGAAALLVISASLAVLYPVMKGFSGMSWEEIGKGLLMLAGTLGVLGGAALLLTPVIPVMIALGAAVTLLGVGMAGVGVGVAALAAGLTALAAGGSAGLTMLIEAIRTIAEEVPFIIEKIAEGLVLLIQKLGESSEEIAQTIVSTIMAIATLLDEKLPEIVEIVLHLIVTLLQGIEEKMPDIVDAGMGIIIGLLQGIDNNIGEIVTQAANIMISFLGALEEKIPEIIDAGVDLVLAVVQGIADNIVKITDAGFEIVIGLIDGIATAIETHSEDLAASVGHLCTSIIDAFLNFFGIKNGASEKMLEQGKALIEGLKSGISSMVDSAVTSIKELGGKILNGFKDFFGIHSPSTVMEQNARMLVDGLINGSSGETSMAAAEMEALGLAMIEGFLKTKEKFKDAGAQVIQALVKGIASVNDKAKSAMDSIATGLVRQFKTHENEFQEAGVYAVNALLNGMSSMSGEVSNAANNLSNSVANGFSGLSSQMQSIGTNAVNGLTAGMNSASDSVGKTAASLGNKAFNSTAKELKVRSPSKKFMWIGQMADAGLAEGIKHFAYLISGASEEAGESAFSPFNKALENANLLFSEVSDPVIRPIFDMSDISDGIRRMDGMFGSDRSMTLAGIVKTNVDRSMATNAFNQSRSEETQITTIEGLRAEFASMVEAMSKFKIILDSGKLVGELAGPMDQALGRQAMLGGRGIQ